MYSENLEHVKRKLDRVGPGFCLAKWNQVTIHLGMGLNHSCYHPQAHPIPLEDIENHPERLSNTDYKKSVRKEMLNGKCPEECSFCWNIEKSGNCWSDRVRKSAEDWAWPSYNTIRSSTGEEDYTPRYVEVSFSNRCTHKCIYCNPDFSSPWQAESEKYGPIQLDDSGFDFLGYLQPEEIRHRCSHPETNPYIKAFMKWWPDLFKTLHTFRLTGGDPLLEKETFELLEYIQEHWEENPDINIALNTNLGIGDKQFDRLWNILYDLGKNNKVGTIGIYTSIETEGKQAEYIRYGMNVDLFWKRIEKLLELPKIQVVFMATYNILAVYGYGKLVDRVYQLKQKYLPREGLDICFDTSYVIFPSILSPRLCSKKQIEILKKDLEKLESYREIDGTDKPGFTPWEVDSAKRVLDYINSSVNTFSPVYEKIKLHRFLCELDRRRNTYYEDVFPEFKRDFFRYYR